MKNRITEYLPTAWFRRKPGQPLDVAETAKHWAEPVREYVVKHPTASLVAAFAAGVAIAWWLKRR
jgi:hypothetical protein